MITAEALARFCETGDSPPEVYEPSVKESSPNTSQAINASPDRLREYLASRGITVKRIAPHGEGGHVLILDGCPMNPEHGRGTDTAVILRSNGVLGFECKHDSCAGYTWSDLRRKIDHEYPGVACTSSPPDSWDNPIPLDRLSLPPFPLEAVPTELSILREYCEAVTRSYQVPPDLPAFLALSVGATCLAKRIVVHVRSDHHEPVNLFTVVSMEPGERKSGVFKAMTFPLTDYEREENGRLAPLIDKNRSDRLILEKRLKLFQDRATRAKDDAELHKAREECSRCQSELRSHPTLHDVRLLADDATPEALGALLSEQDGRIALLSPEGDVFALMAGRYNSKGMPNLGVYLKGHAGDDLRVDRVNKDRPPEYVPSPALTIGLTVQLDVLRGLANTPDFRGRGLLGRFLYALPTSLVGQRRVSVPPVPPYVATAYADLIRKALSVGPVRDEKGELGPRIVRVSADALVRLDELAERIERDLADGGELSAMRDWANKLIGAICRISGVFHGLIHAGVDAPEQHEISVETMLCAMAIGEHAIIHARAAFDEMGISPEMTRARRLLRWIEAKGLTEFSRRDAFLQTRGPAAREVKHVDEPLRMLEEHGYIRPRQVGQLRPKGARGQNPSPMFEVNPVWLAQNTQKPQERSNSAYSAQEDTP